MDWRKTYFSTHLGYRGGISSFQSRILIQTSICGPMCVAIPIPSCAFVDFESISSDKLDAYGIALSAVAQNGSLD